MSALAGAGSMVHEASWDQTPVAEGMFHRPVMVREVLTHLRVQPGRCYVDATVGDGGHAQAILAACGPDGRLLGLDIDDAALTRAAQRCRAFGGRVILLRESFAALDRALARVGWKQVDGILLDLGMSALQVESAERGFSFRLPGPLDMRMDRRQRRTAAKIVNEAPAAELERMFREYGEEPAARAIARRIVAVRRRAPLTTTVGLAEVIVGVVGGAGRRRRHPATRVFQALRMAVNEEVAALARFLADGYRWLATGGRMVVITYHSIEDRLVKGAFRRWAATCLCPPRMPRCVCGWGPKARLLTRRPLRPFPLEVGANPRARSAKLRAVERV